MAKYIKREMVDRNNPGQTIFTYRMKTLPMDNAIGTGITSRGSRSSKVYSLKQ